VGRPFGPRLRNNSAGHCQTQPPRPKARARSAGARAQSAGGGATVAAGSNAARCSGSAPGKKVGTGMPWRGGATCGGGFSPAIAALRRKPAR
jgi:hypothetical protein